MWAGLGLVLVLCLLPGGGTETQNCQEPPEWRVGEENPMLNSRGSVTVVALLQASCYLCLLQASRLEDLRVKLENEGLVNVSYVVVNHQGAYSQKKFHLLKESVSEYITVYQQDEQQADVWTTLNGNKDDFLIYDRCGRLVYHLGLPYSFLSFNYVEEAIKIAYCENKCGNCSYTEPDIDETCENITKKADKKLAEVEPKPSGQHSNHHHQLRKHRHHHHHHRHSKNQNHQAPSETQRRHPHSGRRHRVFDHNIHDQTGSHEHVEIVHPGEGVEILRQGTKLCKKGKASCKNQLTCNWQTASSDSTSSSCCCHCRHLLFEELGNSVTCQCRGALPNSCSCHGQLLAEDITESCQCRLLTAACESTAAGASETSDTCQCQEKAGNCACKTN